ncbi:MAG: hypothetical protein K2J73_11790 [Oscillospiraceae bacterium]|nr:hypothetical protein [Oscillospiraceae bacterium]
MQFLWITLIALALVTFASPLSYIFAENWYRKNPEYPKEKYFLQLEALFGRKYVKFGFFAASVIFWAAAIIVFISYVSLTL